MDLLTWSDIIIQIVLRLGPVWVALVILFLVSFRFKRSLGLYGKLFDSTIGMIGFAIVMFWVFAGFFAGALDWIITHDPLAQFSGMKNKVPGHHFAAPKMATTVTFIRRRSSRSGCFQQNDCRLNYSYHYCSHGDIICFYGGYNFRRSCRILRWAP